MQTETQDRTEGKRLSGPLAGVIVVDLTRVLAGPFCTLLLADLGARVIKIESRQGGDDSRSYGPFINGQSCYFAAENRGKESIALDFTAPDDIAILHRLLRRADIIAENFRPGMMEQFGLSWAALHARYPRLIYAATSGFGLTGPYAHRPAYDIIVQAMGGLMSITGHEGGPPTRVGSSIGDLGAGLFTAIGILAALHHRASTGEGILVDVAMLDCQIAILENAVTRYFATGEIPKPMGARHASIAPFEPYRAADGYVVIACGNDLLFGKLAAALGKPELAQDSRFITNAERSAHVLALKTALEDVLVTAPVAHWVDRLLDAGVPASPINDIAAAAKDPQVLARQMIVTMEDPAIGPLKVTGCPIKMPAFPETGTRAGVPRLDGDRARILADFPA